MINLWRKLRRQKSLKLLVILSSVVLLFMTALLIFCFTGKVEELETREETPRSSQTQASSEQTDTLPSSFQKETSAQEEELKAALKVAQTLEKEEDLEKVKTLVSQLPKEKQGTTPAAIERLEALWQKIKGVEGQIQTAQVTQKEMDIEGAQNALEELKQPDVRAHYERLHQELEGLKTSLLANETTVEENQVPAPPVSPIPEETQTAAVSETPCPKSYTWTQEELDLIIQEALEAGYDGVEFHYQP